MRRHIINIESTSIGKKTNHNDDDIYIGTNFAVVIDGVSNKSMVEIDGKTINIANVITEAIRKIDRKTAPVYAKSLTFEEFIRYINMYIKKYFENLGISVEKNPVEATGAIYSKYHNQIWLVGDCRAIYDGNVISNELKIDEVYIRLRQDIIQELKKAGYSEKELIENDVSKKIIENPQTVLKYVANQEICSRIINKIEDTMRRTLKECGFSDKEIEEKKLLSKFYNPRELQQYLKNNPNMGNYGYSVFNGINTAKENCIIQDLPDNVREIKLFSDGFPINSLNNNRDLGYAIRKNRKIASSDPLSISENKATRPAVKQYKKEKYLALDDASAVVIRIEYTQERDDER